MKKREAGTSAAAETIHATLLSLISFSIRNLQYYDQIPISLRTPSHMQYLQEPGQVLGS